jgi:hypothetical protein
MSMTENEAIKAIQNDLEWHSKELKPTYKQCLQLAIQALEEIQAYRAIGTVEEFKALKEKNEPKKSTEFHKSEVCIDFICPNCKEAVYGQPYKPNYCKHCGQKLDWS